MYNTIKFNDMILADIENFQEVPPCNIAKITLPYSIENSLLAIKNGFVFTDRTILTTIQVSKAEFNFDKLIRVEIEETTSYKDEIKQIAQKAFIDDRRFYYDLECKNTQLSNFIIGKWVDELDQVSVAKYKDVVIGFLALKETSNDTLFIHLAATDEKYRLTGVAMSLYAKALMSAKERGYKKLEGRISTKNLAVMNLYSYLGAHFENPMDIYIKEF